MKKYFIFLFVAIGWVLSFFGCSEDKPSEETSALEENPKIVRQFVYDGMSLYIYGLPICSIKNLPA